MKSNHITNNRQALKEPVTVVKTVTRDKSQWAQNTKYQWIFWIALLMSAAILLGSCKSGTSDGAVNATDTAGLAAFNAQKAADSIAALQVAAPAAAGAAVAAERGRYREGSGAVKSINDQRGNGDNVDDNSAGASSDQADQANQTEASNTASTTPAKKKRFSNAAKGALIGAGSGAVLGAVVAKKNRGLGAVIGAAVGGGAGYGIGKHKDNKQKEQGQ